MRILIADDDQISSRVLTRTLQKWGHEVVDATNGFDAWQIMQDEHAPRISILDWMMPGLNGVDICRKARRQIENAPYLILLTALASKQDLIAGLEAGADDYLTKPFHQQELRVRLQAGIRIVELQDSLAERVRELEAAILERQKAEDALRNLSLTDELTGLYNRRGFLTLAGDRLKAGKRRRQPNLLIYCDMDGLKQINDSRGHAEGSIALQEIAEVLRRTFRESDIIGRLGGDEFAILAPDASLEEENTLAERLAKNLSAYNDLSGRAYQLSLSVGTASTQSNHECDIEELIARADETMYQQKRLKKQPSVLSAALLQGVESVR